MYESINSYSTWFYLRMMAFTILCCKGNGQWIKLACKPSFLQGEFTFSGDKLVEGGQYDEMTNGVKYREVRQYQTDFHLVRFYFVTRCYNSYVESILSDLAKEPQPDVVLINSCLWDISRYLTSICHRLRARKLCHGLKYLQNSLNISCNNKIRFFFTYLLEL